MMLVADSATGCLSSREDRQSTLHKLPTVVTGGSLHSKANSATYWSGIKGTSEPEVNLFVSALAAGRHTTTELLNFYCVTRSFC